jgi:hypothetical protein
MVIAKQDQRIQHLCWLGSHALAVDDIQGPIDVEAHAQDANMLIHNDVIENKVTIVTIVTTITQRHSYTGSQATICCMASSKSNGTIP